MSWLNRVGPQVVRVAAVWAGLGLMVAAPAVAQTTAATTQSTAGQSTDWSLGVRGGAATDPNQLLLGVQLESPDLTAHGHLLFRPNVQIGIFGGMVNVEGNLDVLYWTALPKSSWSLFFGAGPSADFAHISGGGHSEGGTLFAIVGVERSGLSIEARAGSGQRLELVAAYTLKSKH